MELLSTIHVHSFENLLLSQKCFVHSVTSCKRRNVLIGVLKKRRNTDVIKHRLADANRYATASGSSSESCFERVGSELGWVAVFLCYCFFESDVRGRHARNFIPVGVDLQTGTLTLCHRLILLWSYLFLRSIIAIV